MLYKAVNYILHVPEFYSINYIVKLFIYFFFHFLILYYGGHSRSHTHTYTNTLFSAFNFIVSAITENDSSNTRENEKL